MKRFKTPKKFLTNTDRKIYFLKILPTSISWTFSRYWTENCLSNIIFIFIIYTLKSLPEIPKPQPKPEKILEDKLVIGIQPPKPPVDKNASRSRPPAKQSNQKYLLAYHLFKKCNQRQREEEGIFNGGDPETSRQSFRVQRSQIPRSIIKRWPFSEEFPKGNNVRYWCPPFPSQRGILNILIIK